MLMELHDERRSKKLNKTKYFINQDLVFFVRVINFPLNKVLKARLPAFIQVASVTL
jgi:hypothetical protein